MTSIVTDPAPRSAPAAVRPVRRRRILGDFSAYWFLAPGLIVYAIFVLWPIAQTAWLSLFDWNGLTAGRWAGPDNYLRAFGDRRITGALGHSFAFIGFYALLPTAIGLVLTGLLSRVRVYGLTFFRAVLFLPQILATVVIAVAWRWIYDIDGPLNAGLRAIGLGGLTRAWLGDFDLALPSVGMIGAWMTYGLCMVLFLAGAQKIPRELYESARLDGAGAVREFLTVTLPALRGELQVALVLTVTFALRNFDIVWNTTAGGPGSSTAVPSVYIYQGAFLTREVGYAAAISVLLTILILAVTGIVLWTLRERRS